MMVKPGTTVRHRSIVALFLFMAAFVCLQTSCGFFRNAGPVRKPLYRGVNTANGTHDYTGSALEAYRVFCKCQLKYDGAAGFIAQQAYDQYVVLQKMRKSGSPPILVTADAIDSSKKNGYSEDGSSEGYIAKSPFNGSVPLYHLFNVNSGDHLYTVDPGEKATAINSAKYTDEGILGYVWPNEESVKEYKCDPPCPSANSTPR